MPSEKHKKTKTQQKRSPKTGLFVVQHDVSKLDPNFVEELAAKGFGTPQIAAALRMSKATFERAMQQIPEIRDAVHLGREQANGKVIKSMFQKAQDGDVSAQKYWLGARAGWSDQNHKVEHSHKHEHKVVPLTQEDIKKEIVSDPMTDIEPDYVVKEDE